MAKLNQLEQSKRKRAPNGRAAAGQVAAVLGPGSWAIRNREGPLRARNELSFFTNLNSTS